MCRIHRHALWILGEYATSKDDIMSVIDEIKKGLGPVPIVEDEMRLAAGDIPEGIALCTFIPLISKTLVPLLYI